MPNYLETYKSELEQTLNGELHNKPNVVLLHVSPHTGVLHDEIFGKQQKKVADETIHEFLEKKVEMTGSSEEVVEALKEEADQVIHAQEKKAEKPEKNLYDSTVDFFLKPDDIVIPNLVRFDLDNSNFTFYDAEQNDIQINLSVFNRCLALEEDGQDEVNAILKYIDDNYAKTSQIHCVWMDCTQCTSTQLKSIDCAVKVLSANNHIGSRILVLTSGSGELSESLKSIHIDTCKICTANEAVDATRKIYTREDAVALLNSIKKYEAEIMEISSRKAVLAFSASAGAVGLTPIPIADAAILCPLQIAMIKRIVSNYKLEGLFDLSGEIIVSVIATTLGKSAATSLVKFIPGLGSAAGAVAGGTVSSAFTLALGYVIMEICDEVCDEVRVQTMRGNDVDTARLLSSEVIKRRTSEKFEALLDKAKEKTARSNDGEQTGGGKKKKGAAFGKFNPLSKKKNVCECGAKLNKKATKFCSNCGKPVEQ